MTHIAIGRAIVAWATLEIKIDEQLLNMLGHAKTKSIRQSRGIFKLKDIRPALRTALTCPMYWRRLTTAAKR
jgi:hypothetical protein